MKIIAGIDARIGEYKLTSDPICYTLERASVNDNKESKNYGKEVLSFVGYYTSLADVVYGMIKDETRGCGVETLEALYNKVVEIDKLIPMLRKSGIKLVQECPKCKKKEDTLG